MTAHLTSAGMTSVDSMNGSDIAMIRTLPIVTMTSCRPSPLLYYTFTSSSYTLVATCDERHDSGNASIWAFLVSVPSNYSETLYVGVGGGSQSASDSISYYTAYDRVSTETWANDVVYAAGWYGAEQHRLHLGMRWRVLCGGSCGGEAVGRRAVGRRAWAWGGCAACPPPG